MQLLTPSGYKSIEDCAIGEQLIAYDITDGSIIINQLLDKKWFSADIFEDQYSEQEETIDENGDVVIIPPYLIKTKEEIFSDTYGTPVFYVINDTYTFSGYQSIWVNMNIKHVSGIVVGDVIYDEDDQDIIVTSIEQVNAPGWWRLSVSGDHSYIADNITLHNATRYWVGGGASANWNATGNTNWGSSSGGSNNASVPTSVDDVIFDGAGTNGNTNSTISATITILSLNITTGYTSTMTHNAVLTIAGNWTYTGAYTIAGASDITITASSTITSNGVTWINGILLKGNNTKTITLVGNFTIGKTLATEAGIGTNTINKTTTEILNINGLTINESISGTADVYLKSGTWSVNGIISNNLFLDGNVTLSGTLSYNTNTLKYVSGVITTTGSTITFTSASIDSNGMTWNNVTFAAGTTNVLKSNMSISGTLATPTGVDTTLNSTTTETITTSGGINTLSTLKGTAKVILTGGTWNGFMNSNLDINGNATIGTPSYGTGTLTYLGGTITTAGSTLTIFGAVTSTVLNTNGITWNNVTSNINTKTITLTSNLSIGGVLGISGSTTINRTTAETVTCAGGMTINAGLSGTANINWTGGSWSQGATTYGIANNTTIAGNVTLSGANTSISGGTWTYIFGNIKTFSNTLNIRTASTLINFHRIPLNAVIITAGQTITMNHFFIGTSSQICQVSSTGANYIVTFQDQFEKIATNVAISGATLSRPMQMIVITKQKFNTNMSTNIGLRYINQSPNGFAKNNLAISDDSLTGYFGGLVGDPQFIRQG